MITYSQLGNMGRLGNQMFQYSALYGLGFLRGVKEVEGLHTIELLSNHRHPILEDILNYYKNHKFNG